MTGLDTENTATSAATIRKFVLEIVDGRAIQMLERMVSAFSEEISCIELTPKAGRMDWQATLERLHGFIADYNRKLQPDAQPVRATHYASAKRIIDLMIDLYRGNPKTLRDATLTIGGREEHFLCFPTNGAGLVAQLGHQDPRTIDNHLERLAAAELVFRRDNTEGKIRRSGELSTLIYVNKAVIAYYPD